MQVRTSLVLNRLLDTLKGQALEAFVLPLLGDVIVGALGGVEGTCKICNNRVVYTLFDGSGGDKGRGEVVDDFDLVEISFLSGSFPGKYSPHNQSTKQGLLNHHSTHTWLLSFCPLLIPLNVQPPTTPTRVLTK